MLSLKNINKSFSGVQVLFDINADIEEGKVTAVIGENGAGKSTLMNILSGGINDHTGEITLKGEQLIFNNTRDAVEKGISIIHQELNILPDLTAGENIFIGREPLTGGIFIDNNALHNSADEILKQFSFPFPSETKMRNLSVGWQQIVEIAHALSLNTNIIIMDEPTSALSDQETEILFEKIRFLRKQGKTIIFISHRISEVLDISDNIIVMRDGRIAAKISAAETNREDLINLMAGTRVSTERINTKIFTEEILRITDLKAEYNNFSLTGINFALHKGEVLGIAGLLGSGRTELLKFLFGEWGEKYTGSISLKNKNYHPRSSTYAIKKGIVYLPENRKEEGIFPDHSLVFNATVAVLEKYKSWGLLNLSLEKESAESAFNELNVKRVSDETVITSLSGGNQQKVLLSRILLTDPEIILMDDPTRGIDIGSKEEIYNLLSKISSAGISVIITSSEIPELLRVCSRIVVLSNGRQTAVVNAAATGTGEILKFAFTQL